MQNLLALTIWLRMIFVALALACAIPQEENSNRSSFYSATVPWRPPNGISVRGRDWLGPSTITSESNRRRKPHELFDSKTELDASC